EGMCMRNSLVRNLLFLCVFAYAGQSLAQETPSSSPPPPIASSSSNETELLRRLLLVRAKTVYLSVRLEPEAREGPETPTRREKAGARIARLSCVLGNKSEGSQESQRC